MEGTFYLLNHFSFCTTAYRTLFYPVCILLHFVTVLVVTVLQPLLSLDCFFPLSVTCFYVRY